MATFVLVHGAWHGSWCWKRVRKALQAHGHEVFTPTLTGVGERSHLLVPEVNLDTHIEDVVNLMQWEELSDVVLCGHSYGGCVVSGVADRIPDRIRELLYLDAFVLEDGECLHDTLPPSQRDLQVELTRQHGEGWRVPPIPAEVFGVNTADIEWVNRQCTMQSLATFQQAIKLKGTAEATIPTTFILANGWNDSPFPLFYERAKARDWKTLSVPCGHDVMLDRPEELTRVLLGIAA
ncbi:MAG TPA: alpha/beta fold hydrolase [Steroidobacteraceae bacterium]|nr:alpha/beta fold hydrolase [Steroidobacteraceae bacterium]